MRAHIEYISGRFRHSGEQGASNERIITEFLRAYLPKRYSISRRKVLAHTDEDSQQQDVIVYDAERCSPLYSEEEFVMVAVESVYAVVEVKTTLNKDQIEDANAKARSVLTKPMLANPELGPGRRAMAVMQPEPPIGAAFAFGSATSLDAVLANLQSLEEAGDCHLSVVGALDRGALWRMGDKWWKVDSADDALVLFLMSLVEHMNRIPDRYFRLISYYESGPA